MDKSPGTGSLETGIPVGPRSQEMYRRMGTSAEAEIEAHEEHGLLKQGNLIVGASQMSDKQIEEVSAQLSEDKQKAAAISKQKYADRYLSGGSSRRKVFTGVDIPKQ